MKTENGVARAKLGSGCVMEERKKQNRGAREENFQAAPLAVARRPRTRQGFLDWACGHRQGRLRESKVSRDDVRGQGEIGSIVFPWLV
jgi:hypothetical protein